MLEAPCHFPYGGVCNAMAQSRLTSEKWLSAGFDALVQHGPQALKAETLARQIGTTKGSFYWHFKDVDAFHADMISLWAAQAVTSFAVHMAAEPTPPLQLRSLGKPPTPSHPLTDPAIESALRAWGATNHTVANVIADVDAQRIAHLAAALRQLGVTDPDFALLIYSARIGLHAQTHSDGTRPLETLIDLILALR